MRRTRTSVNRGHLTSVFSGQLSSALTHPADFLGSALEGRPQPALEALAQPAYPRPPERDRPVAQAQAPRLAEAVAIARARINGVTPLIPPTGEHAVHLFLQHPLQELLPGGGFQRLPGRA
jgi:hypothetical protein